jgi:hypothetical protein
MSSASPGPESPTWERAVDAEENGVFATFCSPDGRYAVAIEDDGRVCYAYLLDPDDAIVGDVWLYNRCPAPIEPEWGNREGAPYANPRPFVRLEQDFRVPVTIAEFSVNWGEEEGACMARVRVRGRLLAKVTPGSMPGWNVLAAKDGPLAKVLKE